ncbi:hypothetical protein [Massilibacteroides sp.]|uniref:hypothetical protein n=1 Tax=Massilibacteroides sp. TaxID=2034766 RepID=UPI00261B2409|nr:hypothetical protein [Massilibacteroides sp.]MDD4516193.1 hypothetical protein [Massilibacteroides sp.]
MNEVDKSYNDLLSKIRGIQPEIIDSSALTERIMKNMTLPAPSRKPRLLARYFLWASSVACFFFAVLFYSQYSETKAGIPQSQAKFEPNFSRLSQLHEIRQDTPALGQLNCLIRSREQKKEMRKALFHTSNKE